MKDKTFYEVYEIDYILPKYLKNFNQVQFMKDPQANKFSNIVYFDTNNLNFVQVDLRNASTHYIQQMPSESYKFKLQHFYKTTSLETDFYISQCLSFMIFHDFMNTCLVYQEKHKINQAQDPYISYFNCRDLLNNQQIQELFLIDKFYAFGQIDQAVFICQQEFKNEFFEFYIWQPVENYLRFISVGQVLNIRILNLFSIGTKLLEYSKDKEILVSTQKLENGELSLISLQLDEEMKLQKHTVSNLKINQTKVNIVSTPWVVCNEVMCYCSTSQNFILTKIDLKTFENCCILNLQRISEDPKIYFSKFSQSFVYNRKNCMIEEQQFSQHSNCDIHQIYQFIELQIEFHYLHYLIQKDVPSLIENDIINLFQLF